MTIKERQYRNRKIVEYRKTHTLPETGRRFNVDSATVFRICKKAQEDKK